MQNAAQAYGAVAKQIANPRELEADLLLKVASRLKPFTIPGTAPSPNSTRRCSTIASSGRSS